MEIKPLTVHKFYEEWIEKKKPPFVRVVYNVTISRTSKETFFLSWATWSLIAVTVDTLESFRIHLVDERGLGLKTPGISLTAHSRPCFATPAGGWIGTRFNDMPANWWPRLPQKEPDPYTEQERDAILAYYRAIVRVGPMPSFFSVLDRDATK